MVRFIQDEFECDVNAPRDALRSEWLGAISAFESNNVSERFGGHEIRTEFPKLDDRYDKIIKQVQKEIQEADSLASEIRNHVQQRLG